MSNDVFLAFSTYATVVVLKMMFTAPLTGYFRITRKAFSNWEDTALGKKDPEERKKMLQTNPDVERVRRARPLHGSAALQSICGVTFYPHGVLPVGFAPA